MAAELLGHHRDLRPGHELSSSSAARGPNGTTLWNLPAGSAGININATVPTDDLAGRRNAAAPRPP